MNVRGFVITGVAVLAAGGVLGMVPSAVQASSAAGATWTKQAPAASPPGRDSAAMAYDAATSSVVLFGGTNLLGDTWTWNGTTWTKRTPANSPSPRDLAPMAYDAATGNVVLFGGTALVGSKVETLHDTWTWG
jgi:hypothetical protein